MYETILFDLDGTLTDPGLGITNSVAYALKKWNIEVKERSELYKYIGPPLIESFEKFCGFTHDDAVLSLKYYREYFAGKGLFENEVYDGIAELRKRLNPRCMPKRYLNILTCTSILILLPGHRLMRRGLKRTML